MCNFILALHPELRTLSSEGMGLTCCNGSHPTEGDPHLTEDALHRIRGCMDKRVRVPKVSDRVFKDECMFSLDTPFLNTGLYVHLSTWHGVGADFVAMDRDRNNETSGTSLYHRKSFITQPPGGAQESLL